MKSVPDRTGRFKMRPHYDPIELDQSCERIVTDYLKQRYGKVEFPISTDDITCLIERDTDDLDLYADLTQWGPEVEGITEFRRNGKPRVKISRKLSEDPRMENRLRTTLTHEYGHVCFHAYLWDEKFQSSSEGRERGVDRQICMREGIINAPQVDWMEWQAGYACGAFLMPRTRCRKLAEEFRAGIGQATEAPVSPDRAASMIDRVRTAFQVSADAARVRLLKLDIIK